MKEIKKSIQLIIFLLVMQTLFDFYSTMTFPYPDLKPTTIAAGVIIGMCIKMLIIIKKMWVVHVIYQK